MKNFLHFMHLWLFITILVGLAFGVVLSALVFMLAHPLLVPIFAIVVASFFISLIIYENR